MDSHPGSAPLSSADRMMTTHVAAIASLAVLYGGWILVQRWITRLDPGQPGVEGCKSCSGARQCACDPYKGPTKPNVKNIAFRPVSGRLAVVCSPTSIGRLNHKNNSSTKQYRRPISTFEANTRAYTFQPYYKMPLLDGEGRIICSGFCIHSMQEITSSLEASQCPVGAPVTHSVR